MVKLEGYPKDSMSTLYRLIAEYHRDEFPQMLYLASLALTNPIQTAYCERAFSEQNRMRAPSKKEAQERKSEYIVFRDFLVDEVLQLWRKTKPRAIFAKDKTS